MNYNDVTLLGLGLLGVLLHSLVKINSIKKSGKDISFQAYLSDEWASMLISVLVVVVALVCKNDVKQLEDAGKWLGLGFTTLGYMGQSVLVAFMGKAEKRLNQLTGEEPKTTE